MLLGVFDVLRRHIHTSIHTHGRQSVENALYRVGAIADYCSDHDIIISTLDAACGSAAIIWTTRAFTRSNDTTVDTTASVGTGAAGRHSAPFDKTFREPQLSTEQSDKARHSAGDF